MQYACSCNMQKHPFYMYSEALHHIAYTACYNLLQFCFDHDSFITGMDNHCSATMSPNEDHFKNLELKHMGELTVIVPGLTFLRKSIFIMNIEDEYGSIHNIEIPKRLYIPRFEWYCSVPNNEHNKHRLQLLTLWEHVWSMVTWHSLSTGIQRSSRTLSHLMSSHTSHHFRQFLDVFIIEPLLWCISLGGILHS